MKLPHIHFGVALLSVATLLVSGCTVGPNYHKPTAPTAPAFKESAVVPPPNLPDGGWKQVSPNDSALRANWWEIYQDPQLDKLEQQVAVSNQTLKASYEQYMQARAAIQVYRSQYFPTVQAGPSATRERQSSNRPLRVTSSKSTYNDLFLQGQVSWEPDLWGNIRRQVESQRGTAQATAADLANVDLSLRSELATDYFELRGLDTQQRLLDTTVQQYEQYLELTKARFGRGHRLRCGTGANPT
jgi:outer membrane protein TolC